MHSVNQDSFQSRTNPFLKAIKLMPDFSPWSLVSGAGLALGSAWIGAQFSQRNTISQWLRDKRLGSFVEITKAVSKLVIEIEQFSADPKKASIEKYRMALLDLRNACEILFWVGTLEVNRSAWKICDFFGEEIIRLLDYEEREEQVWERLMSELNELQSSFDFHARDSLKTSQDEWTRLANFYVYIRSRYKRLCNKLKK